MRTEEPIPLPQRYAELAAAHPGKLAIVALTVDGGVTELRWGDLQRRASQAARLMAEWGVGADSMVAVALPNSLEHYYATLGAWQLGACVMPMRPHLPDWERARVLDVARPTLVIGDGTGLPDAMTSTQLSADALEAHEPLSLTPVAPRPYQAIGTGGSTGRPKIVVSAGAGAFVPGRSFGPIGERGTFTAGGVHLIAGPLYHSNGFGMGARALFEDQTLVVLERFEPRLALDAIERWRVTCGTLVPTMLWRLLQLEEDLDQRDLSSIECVLVGGASVAGWVFERWIGLLGGDHLLQGYGASEGVGMTLVTGTEWLQRPGTVGRPVECDLKIVDIDPDRGPVPPGHVGEIFMRPLGDGPPPYTYIGAPPATTDAEGFTSVGDLGWVDDDGYLFIADRRVDMIVTGAANVYPAEVEAALSEHPGVADVAVIGLSDDRWSRVVHAVVQPRDPANPPSVEGLRDHCRQRLAPYKVPKAIELVDALPRDGMGKISRSSLLKERDHEVRQS